MATNAKGPSLASGPSASVVTATATATAPGTPTVTVGAGDTKVTATMTAGTGVTPTSYTVTAYTTAGVAAGTGCTATVAPWSCDVTGLTNGTTYTVKVTATKAGVTSPVPAVSASVTPTEVFKQTYALGADGPAGGYVFYFSPDAFTSTGSACNDSCHYLESNGVDLPVAYPRGYQWCTTAAPKIFGTAIGSGYENTRKLLAGCAQGAAQVAKSTCPTVKKCGSEWFLPSKDELNELYKAWATAPPIHAIMHFSTTRFYWSSSMTNDPSLWTKNASLCIWNQKFTDGTFACNNGLAEHLIRQVRAF
jgi:hypothetical protein